MNTSIGQAVTIPDRVSKFLLWFAFAAMSCACLYPLIWLLMNSFKTTNEMFDNSWQLPNIWIWKNYIDAWEFGIQNYLINSFIVSTVSVIGILFFSALASYALVALHFPGKNFVYAVIVGGAILPPEVSLFPLFKILTSLRIYNTYWALIIPYIAFGIPFTTFLIRAYMVKIPLELNEAATLDGASPFRIFRSIYLPLCRPILASAGLIAAMRVWNEFIFALTFVESENVKTITIGVMGFANALRSNWTVLMAGLVISILPILFCFIILQKQIIGSIGQSSLK